MAGVTAAVMSTSGMAVSLSGIEVSAGAPMAGLAGFLGFMTTAFSVGCKTLNKKITKHEITTSIAEAKQLSVSRLFSKAIENNPISDMEFHSSFHEIEQYKSLKRQLKNKAKISSEVDVDAIREQIKEDCQRKIVKESLEVAEREK